MTKIHCLLETVDSGTAWGQPTLNHRHVKNIELLLLLVRDRTEMLLYIDVVEKVFKIHFRAEAFFNKYISSVK